MSEMNIPEPQSRREYFLRKIAYPDAPCPAPETREEQYLEAIAQNKGGGGEPSGGGDLFVVKLTDDGAGGVSADKTYAEIVAADAAGKVCFADSGGAGKCFLVIQDNYALANFQSVVLATGGVGVLSVVNVLIAPDDTITVATGVFMLTAAN